MGEDDQIKILGDDPVHMAAVGYLKLAGSFISLAENLRTIFDWEKRDREECEDDEGKENYHRKTHKWLFEAVSGSGGWQSGQQARASGQNRGREAGRGENKGQRVGGKGGYGQEMGRMGGNTFSSSPNLCK
jgi:hypothetical protein